MGPITRKVLAMRRRLASWLRSLADRLDPSAVDALMPLARDAVRKLDGAKQPGSIKWLLAMKSIEKATGAPRRYINAAIDRAVLEHRP